MKVTPVRELSATSTDALAVRSAPNSPKRPRFEVPEAADVYPYYAGYSYEWAKETIIQSTREHSRILDPWNGSGTTTLAAARAGRSAVGVDLNPALAVIARARLSDQAGTLPTLERVPADNLDTGGSEEPLNYWLTGPTSLHLRRWVLHSRSLDRSTNAVLTVAIFRVIRQLTRTFEGSNPTWVRRSKLSKELVAVGREHLDTLIQAQYATVRSMLPRHAPAADIRLLTANAGLLPLSSSSVDTIIGSPPYLTRIDYAVYYSRELAALGIDPGTSRLRAELMGTTLIRAGNQDPAPPRVQAVEDLIGRISSHRSKDSGGYYRKQAVQYFNDLYAAFNEVTRIARPHANAILVLQDSYYKDVPIPLSELACEILDGLGWRTIQAESTRVSRLVSSMNVSSRSYERQAVTESVVSLERRLR